MSLAINIYELLSVVFRKCKYFATEYPRFQRVIHVVAFRTVTSVAGAVVVVVTCV